jgi:hypothetical protein
MEVGTTLLPRSPFEPDVRICLRQLSHSLPLNDSEFNRANWLKERGCNPLLRIADSHSSLWQILREQLLGFTGSDAFVEVVVHQAHRRGATGGQALGEFEGKFPAG